MWLSTEVNRAIPTWLDNWMGEVVLISAAASAAILLWRKVLWHPRSWFRRPIVFVFVRVCSEPVARKFRRYGDAFVERSIAGEFAAIRKLIAELSERNDEQHQAAQDARAEAVASMKTVNERVTDLAQALHSNSTALNSLTEVVAHHILTNPPLPEHPRSDDHSL